MAVSMMSAQAYDVIIVGGGMVGAALACALASNNGRPLHIALLEARPPKPPQYGDDVGLRVSAINLANQRFLNNIGAWPWLAEQDRICLCSAMKVWETDGVEVHFDCADIDEPALGYFVENKWLQHALLRRCQTLSNVHLYAPCNIQSIDIATDAVSVQCDAQLLQGRLLIGADGANSNVRQVAQIGCHAWDYPQQALVATIRSDLTQQHLTWQRFTPTGAQAFLPLAQQHASLVWYHTPAEIQTLLNLSDADFGAALRQYFPSQLGGIDRLIGRASFPLRRMHAQCYVKPRVALVGDAAHTVHPLAGQGVNMGLLDAAVLAEVLLDSLSQGSDLGRLSVLRQYERWRRHDNVAMLAVTDSFYRIFNNQNPLLRVGRNGGLLLSRVVTPLKNQAMRTALGLTGRLPRLAHASDPF